MSWSTMESLLPEYEADVVRETVVAVPPEITYDAITETDLLDPMVRVLFAVWELPERILARLRGEWPSAPPREITVKDFLEPHSGMTLILEEPDVELVVGSVGRFRERNYGHRRVSSDDFAGFREPGYAKLLMGFLVQPAGEERSVLRYEARTATTDEEARRRFLRYWCLIQPGVRLVMGRAMASIRKEAERRAASPKR